ncbi:MAG: phage tail protein [Ktedonobacteraceae bacterium]
MSDIPLPGTLCTGDTISAQQISWRFQSPNDAWIIKAVYGLLYDYAQNNAWTKCGAITVEEAREAFTNIWSSLTVVSDIGTVIMAATIALPANCLPCDGASYLRTDYPQLFAAIGVLWGSADSTHFNVPFISGRVPVASGTGTLLTPRTITQEFGAEGVALAVVEMPAHSHSGIPTFVPTAAGLEVTFASLQTALSVDTGVTGSGAEHDNMQPSLVLNFGIVAK